MSNGAPKSFTEYFDLHCSDNRSKSKIHLQDDKNLEIITDRLENEDWKPLIKALKAETNNLHSVIIRSKYLRNDQFRNNKLHTKEPAFLNENLLQSILEAIKKCIQNSQIMCSLYVEGFPLNNRIELLNDGINKQIHLQHLALPYCQMTDEDVTLLCYSIYRHTGLQTINLTGCGITCKGAKEISAVIRSQKLVRYGETWKQSLRYRLPQPDVLPGLRRITLNNNNKIGDHGFKLISYELIDDLWIKAVDFQNCGLTNSSVEDILELIKTNPTIIILDVRRNDISTGIIKIVIDQLKKNIIDSENEKYSWINNSVISSSLTVSTARQKINPPASRKKSFLTTKTNLNISNSTQIKSDSINDKKQSSTLLSELKETKVMLQKVSSSLKEEKLKREAIEKEHNKFKCQIEEIRKSLLQHNTRKPITSTTSDKSVVGKRLSENRTSVINKDKARSEKSKIAKENNRRQYFRKNTLKSTKLLLMIPAEIESEFHKFLHSSQKILSQSKSNNSNGMKNCNKQKKGMKSESQIARRKSLKSTIAVNYSS